MNIWEYFLVALRHKFFIISLTIILSFTGYFFAVWKVKPAYITTIFLSIANSGEKENQASSTLENLQSADLFSETIQGWFRNPYFLKEVEKKAGLGSSISAKKQEKQNLVIQFEADNQTHSEQIKNAIEETLKSELAAYNNASSTDFSFALLNSESSLKTANRSLYTGLSFIIGLIIAYLAVFLFEKKQNFLMSRKEIYKIFKSYPLFEAHSIKNLKKEQSKLLNFLQTFYKNKDTQWLFFNPENEKSITDILKSEKDFKKKFKIFTFPEDLPSLNSSLPLILICQFGKTTLADLEKIIKLDLIKSELILIH